MTTKQPELEELVDFPTTFTFRLVADSHPEMERRCAAAVTNTLDRPILGTNTKPSKNGKFTSVRIMATVVDADEIRACYAALHGLDGVKMML